MPAFSTLIPLADPVTAFEVIVTVEPWAAFLANMPCFPALEPVTVFNALTDIVPVAVLLAYTP